MRFWIPHLSPIQASSHVDSGDLPSAQAALKKGTYILDKPTVS